MRDGRTTSEDRATQLEALSLAMKMFEYNDRAILNRVKATNIDLAFL